jgi:ribosome maturation factor RimP
MSLEETIYEALAPVVEATGFFLEEVQITSSGKRRVIICVVDGENNLNLDEVTLVSRQIAGVVEDAPFMGQMPFTLEVTSPGVDRPLTKKRHWTKNRTRLVRVVMLNGDVFAGRLGEVRDGSVLLLTEGKDAEETEIFFSDIKKALVEIEFNRKGDNL